MTSPTHREAPYPKSIFARNLTRWTGTLELMGVQAPVGEAVRLRVLAQDVLLSRVRPEGLSAQNILPVTVKAIREGGGPGAAVALDAAGDTLLARITSRAVASLELTAGQQVFAIVKATSVAQSAISGGVTSSPESDS